MKKKLKAGILCGLIVIALSLCLTWGLSARDRKVLTSTGTITSIKGRVITLNSIEVFYSDMDRRFPVWVKKGARATLTYYRKGHRNYYYDIAPEKQTGAVEEH